MLAARLLVAPLEELGALLRRRLLARRLSDLVPVRFETIIITLKSLVLVLALLIRVVVAIYDNRRE